MLDSALIPPPALTIDQPSPGSSKFAGLSVLLSGTGHDLVDGALPSSSLSWRSNLDGPLGVGDSLAIATLTTGTHSLVLTGSTARGAVATTAVSFEVRPRAEAPPPSVWMTSPHGDGAYFEVVPIWFAAQASSVLDGFIGSPDVSWTSDRDGALDSRSSFERTGLQTGPHLITFTARDSLGRQTSTTRTLVVRPASELPPPNVWLLSPANESSNYAGLPVRLEATGIDLADGSLPDDAYAWSSTLDGVLGTGASLTTTALTVGTHLLSVTGVNGRGRSTVVTAELAIRPASELPPPLVLLHAPEPGTTAYAGRPLRLHATAHDLADGGIAGLSWSSSLTGFIGAGESIETAALAAGAHLLEASASNSRGVTGTATVSLEVLPLSAAPPPSIAILSPQAGQTYTVGVRLPFAATATDGLGANLSSDAIVWSAEGAGELGRGESLNLVVPFPGTFKVRATAVTSWGRTTSSSLTLQAVDPDQMTFPSVSIVAPVSGTAVAYGEAIGFFGRATDPDGGTALPEERLLWTSDRDGVLGTGPSLAHAFTTTGTRRVILWATSDRGATSFRDITLDVRPPVPEVTLQQPVSGHSVYAGDVVALRAFSSDAADTEVTGPAVLWSSSRQGTLATGLSTAATLSATGDTLISVTVTNSHGVSAAATALVIVQAPPPPEVYLVSPGSGRVQFNGRPVRFECVAHDVRDGFLAGAAIAWVSDLQGTLGTGTSFTASLVATGAHVVTVVATSSAGKQARATMTVTVADGSTLSGPSVHIYAPAAGGAAYGSVPIRAHGFASDPVDEALPESAYAWSSNLDGPLGAGSQAAFALATGSHTLLLRVTDSRGRTGDATVAVEVWSALSIPAPTVEIWSPQASRRYYRTLPVEFLGFARNFENRELSGASLVWLTNRAGLIGIGNSLATTTLATGPTVVTLAGTDSRGATVEATTEIVVEPAGNIPLPCIRVTAPEPSGDYYQGVPAWFAATVTDGVTGEPLPPDTVQWRSDRDGPLARGPSFPGTLQTSGAHVVTVSASAHGKTSALSMVIEVKGASQIPPPSVSIVSPDPAGVYYAGGSVHFAANASDLVDPSFPPQQIGWVSDRDGPLGSSGSMNAVLTTTGSHRITVQAVNSRGVTGQATCAITLLDPSEVPLSVAIASPREGDVFYAGYPVYCSGEASDVLDGILWGSSVSWSSDLGGPIGTGVSVSAETLATGTHRVTLAACNSHGRSGSTTVTIQVLPASAAPPPVARITSPAADGHGVLTGVELWIAGDALDFRGLPVAESGLRWYDAAGTFLAAGHYLARQWGEPGSYSVRLEATDCRGQIGSATRVVVVRAPVPLAVIEEPSAASGFDSRRGEGVLFAGHLEDGRGATIAAASCRWSSDRDGLLAAEPTLETTALSVGNHVVALSASAQSVSTVTTTIRITISPPTPSVAIASPKNHEVWPSYRPIVVSAFGFDPLDGELPSSAFRWSVNGRPAAQGRFVNLGRWRAGAQAITVAASNAYGQVATAAVTLDVVEPAVRVNIYEPRDQAVVQPYAPVSFKGEAAEESVYRQFSLPHDGFVWKSDRDGVLASGTQSFVTTTLSPGWHAIELSVSANGLTTGQHTIHVQVNPPVPALRILSPQPGAIYFPGATVFALADAVAGPLRAADFTFSWWSEPPSLASSQPAFTAEGLDLGTYTLQCRAVSAWGTAATTRVTFHVMNEPAISRVDRVDAAGNHVLIFDGTEVPPRPPAQPFGDCAFSGDRAFELAIGNPTGKPLEMLVNLGQREVALVREVQVLQPGTTTPVAVYPVTTDDLDFGALRVPIGGELQSVVVSLVLTAVPPPPRELAENRLRASLRYATQDVSLPRRALFRWIQADADGDGLRADAEAEAGTDPASADTDGDGVGDGAEVTAGTDPLTGIADTDRDGLLDAQETARGTDISIRDTDRDGLWDGDEVRRGTSPLDTDTDHDALPDGIEVFHADSDPLVADTDGDGLKDGAEFFRYRTDLGEADTDGDGLPDGLEVQTAVPFGMTAGVVPGAGTGPGTGATSGSSPAPGLDPRTRDADGDGLSDGDEVQRYGTNPNSRDTDGDGLGDREEISLRTSPRKRDTDGDGLEDKHELDVHKTDPTRIDTDGDELGDGEELLRYGSDPLNVDTDDDHLTDRDEVLHVWPSNPRAWDSDSDGIGDFDERKLQSKPMNPDTDGDGLGDGHERSLGTSVTEADTDGDTLSDFADWHENFDPGLADSNQDGVRDDEAFRQGLPPMADSDGDGFSDLDELKKYRTNPFAWDMDGDYVPDSVEVLLGRTSPKLAKTDRKTRDDHVLNAAGLFPEWELLGCARVNSSLVVWRVPKAGKAEPLDPGNVYWTHDLGLAVEVENPHCYPYVMHVIAEEVLDPDQPMDLARTYYHSLVYGRNRILIPVWSSPSGTVTLKLKDGNGRVYAHRVLSRKKDIRIADVIRVDYDKVETSIYDAVLNKFTGDLYPTDRAVIYYIDNAHPFPVLFDVTTPYGVSNRFVNVEYPVQEIVDNRLTVRIPPGQLGVRIRINLKPPRPTASESGQVFGAAAGAGTGGASGAGSSGSAAESNSRIRSERGTQYRNAIGFDTNYTVTSLQIFHDLANQQAAGPTRAFGASEDLHVTATIDLDIQQPPTIPVRIVSNETLSPDRMASLPREKVLHLEHASGRLYRKRIGASELVPAGPGGDGIPEIAAFDFEENPQARPWNKGRHTVTDSKGFVDSQLLNPVVKSRGWGQPVGAASGTSSFEKQIVPFKLEFLQLGGVESFLVGAVIADSESYGSASADAVAYAFVENQADTVYINAHGVHRTGKITPYENGKEGVYPEQLMENWTGRDVDTLILRACYVLDVRDYHARSLSKEERDKWSKSAMASPGERWEQLGVKVILGYAWNVRADTDDELFGPDTHHGADMIKEWKNRIGPNPSAETMCRTWIETNLKFGEKHASAVDRSEGRHVYHYTVWSTEEGRWEPDKETRPSGGGWPD